MKHIVNLNDYNINQNDIWFEEMVKWLSANVSYKYRYQTKRVSNKVYYRTWSKKWNYTCVTVYLSNDSPNMRYYANKQYVRLNSYNHSIFVKRSVKFADENDAILFKLAF